VFRTVRRRRASAALPESGSVSAEAAVALPALVVFAAALIWGIGAATAQSKCTSAARSAALATARGEQEAAVQAHVRAALGPSATFTATRNGRAVRVSVTAVVAGLGILPARQVSADAVAELEPAAPAP
jgi:hypothetical protein